MRPHMMRVWVLAGLVLACSAAAWAAPKGDDGLSKPLGGGDEAAAREAMAAASSKLADAKPGAVRGWVQALSKAKRWDAAAELAGRALLAQPGDAALVGDLAGVRAKALLERAKAAGNEGGSEGGEGGEESWQAALGAAGAWYRVADATKVADAVAAVGEALEGAHGEAGRATARRWRLEQLMVQGGPSPSAGEGKRDGEGGAILYTLPRDPLAERFVAAAAGLTGERYQDHQARAHLLLLAGDAAGAGFAARQAYEVAPDDRLAEATGLVARAMRARDGSMAGANIWLERLRAEAEEH